MEDDILNEIFTSDEIEKIKKLRNFGFVQISHPLLYLFNNANNSVSENTIKAFYCINKNNREYINKVKREILKDKDFSNINAKLGEIRCYGYMLSAFDKDKYNISKIKENANSEMPDFKITNIQTNEDIYIEVYTKQANVKETEKLQEFLNNSTKREKGFYFHSYTPLGRRTNTITDISNHSKTTLLENVEITALNKLIEIKSDSNQLKGKNGPGILWIDFQSEKINGFLSLEEFEKIRYKNGEKFSGICWLALYGKKGFSIYRGKDFFKINSRSNYESMLNDGIFFSRPEVSGVIISADTYSLFFENPYCQSKLPNWFLNDITKIPNYNNEYSIYY